MAEEIDQRVAIDRSEDTQPGEYYAHFVVGRCDKHGSTRVRCVHTLQPDGTTTTEVSCMICKVAPA